MSGGPAAEDAAVLVSVDRAFYETSVPTVDVQPAPG
jgi:hypothetical protein